MISFMKNVSVALLLVALQPASAAIGKGLTLAEAPMPDCNDIGQNDPFQGRSLINKATGICDKINICHGTGSETNPWIMITVAKGADNGLPGHTGIEHNAFDGVTGKRPDYYPDTYSVPNPNGAGNSYGTIDGNCNFKEYFKAELTRGVCLQGNACRTVIRTSNIVGGGPPRSNIMVGGGPPLGPPPS